MAEKMPDWSPYSYAFDNPIKNIDIMGLIPWPVPLKWTKKGRVIKKRVDSAFGMRDRNGKKKMHKGLDINLGGGKDDYGVPIYATHDGVVEMSKDKSDGNGAGNRIHIKSADGSFKTVYMHLKEPSKLKAGAKVKEGDVIGYIGGSGYGKEFGLAVHLHYEIHKKNEDGKMEAIDPMPNNKIIDPQKWISGENRNLPEGEEFAVYDENDKFVGTGVTYSEEDIKKIQNWLDSQDEKSSNLLEGLLRLLRN